MKELIVRFTNESPSLFKKIQLVGAALAVVGGVLIANPYNLPEIFPTIGGYVATAGLIAAGIAKLPVKDSSKLPSKK